eukprot:CAMPEP_0171090800 /NCGR_PEP_ID=MMETSP0766_2-20121228/32071_1 /TAXON_ID=439317 /ORGANISM="Gambierdiscus australes, Strain CAWD 149" /LENGTH=67 /DNA_ID=CAMNT_0011548833 /DNA_START=85 /DNA_END=285 /DNA_ORIENTATION=+
MVRLAGQGTPPSWPRDTSLLAKGHLLAGQRTWKIMLEEAGGPRPLACPAQSETISSAPTKMVFEVWV